MKRVKNKKKKEKKCAFLFFRHLLICTDWLSKMDVRFLSIEWKQNGRQSKNILGCFLNSQVNVAKLQTFQTFFSFSSLSYSTCVCYNWLASINLIWQKTHLVLLIFWIEIEQDSCITFDWFQNKRLLVRLVICELIIKVKKMNFCLLSFCYLEIVLFSKWRRKTNLHLENDKENPNWFASLALVQAMQIPLLFLTLIMFRRRNLTFKTKINTWKTNDDDDVDWQQDNHHEQFAFLPVEKLN